MAGVTVSRDKAAALQYGCMFIYGLGTGYPDLKPMVQRIFAERVARLKFVPATWLAGVQQLQNENPTDLLTFAPGRRPKTSPTGGWVSDEGGERSADLPMFLETEEQVDAWHAIYVDLNRARAKYAAAQAAAGRAELDRLYAKAAFWDAAYKVAVFAKDLPSAIVKTVGGGVVDVVGTFLPQSLKAYAKWITLALGVLIVGGIVMWYRKKITALIKGFKGGK